MRLLLEKKQYQYRHWPSIFSFLFLCAYFSNATAADDDDPGDVKSNSSLIRLLNEVDMRGPDTAYRYVRVGEKVFKRQPLNRTAYVYWSLDGEALYITGFPPVKIPEHLRGTDLQCYAGKSCSLGLDQTGVCFENTDTGFRLEGSTLATAFYDRDYFYLLRNSRGLCFEVDLLKGVIHSVPILSGDQYSYLGQGIVIAWAHTQDASEEMGFRVDYRFFKRRGVGVYEKLPGGFCLSKLQSIFVTFEKIGDNLWRHYPIRGDAAEYVSCIECCRDFFTGGAECEKMRRPYWCADAEFIENPGGVVFSFTNTKQVCVALMLWGT